MLYPEFRNVGYKSKLESPTLIGDINEIQVPSQPAEFYTSVYRFAEDVSHLSSLANLPSHTLGFADFLYLDLDGHGGLDTPFADCMGICTNLDKLGAVYQVWFSGGKGFHISIPTSQFGFEPTADEGILKRMAEAIKGDASSFDSSVYNKTRIFRYPNTFNIKGGLYKVEIRNLAETSLEDILQRAQTCWENIGYENDLPLCQPLVELYRACKQKPSVEVHSAPVRADLFAPAMEGSRNESAFSLAHRLFKKGLDRDSVEWITSRWNRDNPKPLQPDELYKVLNSAEKGRIELLDGRIEEQFKTVGSYLKALPGKLATGKGKFKTGYDFLDSYTFGFGAGELIFIAARSGNFKTSFLSNILYRGSNLSKRQALFFSMEMSEDDLMPRLFQMCEGMTHKQVMEAMASGYDFPIAREQLQYLTVVYMSNLTTAQMMDIMEGFYKKHGDPCAIGVDYLGFFKGANNNTQVTAQQAQDLKTVIGKVANCPIFVLCQAKQVYEGRGGDVELDRTCVKDSDSVLDSGDFGIGMWGKYHTFITPEGVMEEKILYGKFYKSRRMDAELYKPEPYFALNWEKSHMRLKDIVYVPEAPHFRQRREEK